MSEYDFYDALHKSDRKLSIHYKWKPNEKDISLYNTAILNLIKSNMNLQYVTGMYGLLTYLASYPCKSERTMGQLLWKAFKESSSYGVKGLRKAGSVYLKTREVLAYKAIAHAISAISLSSQLSNIDVIYLPSGLKKNRMRMLKSQNELDKMELGDNNIYQVNIIDKYANRPDTWCLADFGTTYTWKNSVEVSTGSDDIENYTIPVSAVNVDNEIPEHVTEQLSSEQQANLITLKNNLGKMKKKSHPCVMCCHMESKFKNPEQYYMTLLQLYIPWRDEDNLKGIYHTFEDKYLAVESTIKPNILKCNKYFETLDSNDDILDNHYDYSLSNDNSDDDNDYEN